MADYNLILPTGEYLLEGSAVLLDQSDRPEQCHGEWIDIDVAMQMLGATDEEVVENLIAEVGALITAYLGRELLLCTHTDTFFRPGMDGLRLTNYPVTDWHSIRFDGVRGEMSAYDLNAQLGYIVKACSQPSDPYLYCGQVTVNYTAGYNSPPRELQSMFRALLVDYYSSGGSTEGSVGSIKKVSLTGVAAVEFNSPGITYSGVDQQLGVPNALKQYTGLLDRYRSDITYGIV